VGLKEQEGLERAAKFLLEGATMIQRSCPQCKSPLYQFRDESLACATCNAKVLFEEDLAKNEGKQKLKVNSPNNKTNESNNPNPIQLKINQLSNQLAEENNLEKIKELSETIRHLEKIRDS